METTKKDDQFFVLKDNRLIWVLFALVVFACWKADVHFFWRDEWVFLKEMQSVDFAFFFQSVNGHIKPVFKFVYWLELHAFGVNTLFYLYFNLILFSFTAFFFFKLSNLLIQHALTAFLITLAFIAHPLNYNNLLWTFQICQTLHMMFQLMAVYYLWVYYKTDVPKHYYLALGFLVLQNYSFGNGIFMPMLFIYFFLFISASGKRIQRLIQVCVLQAVFIAVQMLGSKQKVSVSINEIGDLIYSLFSFAGLNISRVIFLRETLAGFTMIWISLFILLAMLFYVLVRHKKHLPVFVFFVLWFALTCVSIPLARKGMQQFVMAHYYSVMSMIPFLACLIYFIRHVTVSNFVPYKKIGLIVLIVFGSVYFFIDQKMVNVFVVRDFNNQLLLEQVFETKQRYVGFDDPFFPADSALRGMEHPEVDYDYWRKKTRFRFPNSYPDKSVHVTEVKTLVP